MVFTDRGVLTGGRMKHAAAKTWKAILADTDNDAVASIRGCMQSFGYDTERVRDPEAIVSALNGRTRAVVIASASLPELDPAQLCRDVRAAARNVYVLLLVDGDTKEAIELAFEAGADDVLSKSIGEAELRARLSLATRVVALEDDRNRMHGEGNLLAEISVNTTLHSRRYLEVELGRELDRARRFAHPVGVLLAQAQQWRPRRTHGAGVWRAALRPSALSRGLGSALRRALVRSRAAGDHARRRGAGRAEAASRRSTATR